jgi:hypothetical protein
MLSVGLLPSAASLLVANGLALGWILLALCVTLVNAGSGLSSLWILLTCVGYVLFLLYLIKPALAWFLRRTGSIENGPSQSIIALILLIALASAFFTGIIGVHPIFGGFVVGLIIPRDGAFAIRVTEKLEDLIGAIFLPLYFTLSGLNTDLGLLDNGITWGYVFAVTLVAFFTKLSGATLAARLNGLVWRESFTIGVLMSCKGLVELIVLVSRGAESCLLKGSEDAQMLTCWTEHRSTSQDSEHKDVHHFRRHGPPDDIHYHAARHCPVPTVVPEEARGMEAWRDRLGLRRASLRSQRQPERRVEAGETRQRPCPSPSSLPPS